jgi:hypothetical protein
VELDPRWSQTPDDLLVAVARRCIIHDPNLHLLRPRVLIEDGTQRTDEAIVTIVGWYHH